MTHETLIAVRVIPRARRNEVQAEGAGYRVRVTAPPADGKANVAVTKLLACHLKVAPQRLELVRGAKGRHKLFRLRAP